MQLLIVESPSKAKTIEKYLSAEGSAKAGRDHYVVRASVGHIRDLPKSNKKAIDIPGGFIPHYEISKGKEHVVEELMSLGRKATTILLATDPDREGEAIAWHIEELLRQDKKIKAPIKRVAFHEITKEAVTEALTHPRDIDTNLRRAQEARRVLDRLVGYDLSGLIWKKVRYGLSAGRVQSPALRILCEREREIRAFIPETYWALSGTWKTPTGETIALTCVDEPRDDKEVERILEIGRKEKWHVKEVKATEQKRVPRAPFTTSTLQQVASTRLGFSPSRTMMVAQKLYEAGHISYMRTDSTNLAESAVKQIAAIVEKQYGKEYLMVRTYKTKSKNAQEAHEAIRPTHVEKKNAGTTDEQKRLYNLIWERTVSSQMSDAKLLKTKIAANVSLPSASQSLGTSPQAGEEKNSIPDFTATGSRILFLGWLKADPDARGEDVELPKLEEKDKLELIELGSLEKQTEPPNRYSEAGLVKELEARDIGRPSTYAAIIRTLETRGYMEKIARALKPTDTGEVVSGFLEENFMQYISDTFTAEMENELDEIAAGERDYTKTLTDFYGPFAKDVASKESIEKLTTLEDADAKYKCPKCSASMVIKLGRMGKFISCSRYPDCDGALTIEGHEIKPDESIGNDPATGLPIFVKTGRFGPYVQLGISLPKGVKKKRPPSGGAKKKKSADASTETAEATAPQKPKMASIPKEKNPTEVTLADALHYLSLPRVLGTHPDSGKPITASVGRFGPYVAHDGDYRSIKKPLDVYAITLEEALALLAQEKKKRGFQKKVK